MDTLLFDLLEIIKTTEDKNQFLTQMNSISSTLFSQEKDVINLLGKTVSYKKKEALMHMAQKNNISLTDGKTFITRVKNAVVQLPEVSMTLAFAPTEEVVNTISTWFVMSIKKAILLDITVDKTLIGGAVVGYKGIHKDFSLRRKMNDTYANGQLQIALNNDT